VEKFQKLLKGLNAMGTQTGRILFANEKVRPIDGREFSQQACTWETVWSIETYRNGRFLDLI
jgi:hypothetical protein